MTGPAPESSDLNVTRTTIIIAALMGAASLTAVLAHPNDQAMHAGPAISLESMVSKQFGDWQQDLQPATAMVNPQTQQLLTKLYSQMLTRSYVSKDGYRIMLSIAYGNDQRGALQAHKPEVCYPAQGFSLQSNETAQLATAYGSIPVQRLFATMGARQEPVTYWFKFGDSAVHGAFQKRLIELRYRLTGEIPDGLLFRVSSIDTSVANAQLKQDQFVNQLLTSMSPADRQRLSGLGDAAVPGT